jgi:hypothetical protein
MMEFDFFSGGLWMGKFDIFMKIGEVMVIDEGGF